MRLTPQTRQVSLQDIHGVDVPFVWAQVTRLVEIDAGSPTALIIGSAIEIEDRTVAVAPDADIQAQCCTIANTLARHRLNLVSDACPGIPNLIERAYLGQASRGIAVGLSVLRSPDELDTRRAYSPSGFPSAADVVLFSGSGFEVLSILNTHCADIALVVGGGLGSLMEGIIAVINDLPVVCFSPSGGVACEMQPLFERYRSRYKHLRITTCAATDTLDAFFADFAADFRRRRATTRLHAFMSRLEPCQPDLLLDTEILVERDLQNVTFRRGETFLQIPNPVLLIDDARMIEETAAGVAIRSCLDTAPRQYRYEGVTIRVPQGIPPVVWCPSIDTFIMLGIIRPHLQKPYRRALDVGTGTGVIALWLVATDRVASVVGIDKNPEATRCASVNATAMGLEQRCSIRTERYQSFREDAQAFDLITCNPPYVPRQVGDDRDDGGFDGVSLLIDLLSTLDRVLTHDGVCFISLSSASWTDPAVLELMQEFIAQDRAVLVHECWLPFKVADVLVDQQWLRHLLGNGGLFPQTSDHYAYWHKIQVWKLYARVVEEKGVSV